MPSHTMACDHLQPLYWPKQPMNMVTDLWVTILDVRFLVLQLESPTDQNGRKEVSDHCGLLRNRFQPIYDCFQPHCDQPFVVLASSHKDSVTGV